MLENERLKWGVEKQSRINDSEWGVRRKERMLDRSYVCRGIISSTGAPHAKI